MRLASVVPPKGIKSLVFRSKIMALPTNRFSRGLARFKPQRKPSTSSPAAKRTSESGNIIVLPRKDSLSYSNVAGQKAIGSKVRMVNEQLAVVDGNHGRWNVIFRIGNKLKRKSAS